MTLTAFAATVPVQTTFGGGEHLENIPNRADNIPKWGKAFFIAEVMYLLTLCAAKLSIIVLLLRFATSLTMTWVLRLTALVTTIMTVAFVFWITFQCQPVEHQWDARVPGVCASRLAYTVSVYVLSAVSAGTDILTAITPIFILRAMTLHRKSKIAAGVTLAIGSLYNDSMFTHMGIC